ncbi:hypothetical protein [Streptacidiphilus rugosus]|uniref:hypothetical protein n=1 Tax=Streptacidiphilus rugosus TaxID=405783 RepID=UPI00055C003F|nr:hypothetical protein [Streptacidiphilus rugosus]
MRRWTAVAAMVLLVLEAGVSVLFALVMGKAANYQHMQLAGLKTSAIANGAYVGLSVQAAFLLLVAVLLLRLAIRATSETGRLTRFAVIAAAVFHGILAALLLALSGVTAFLVVALTLTLLVLVLFIPPSGSPAPATTPTPPAPPVPPTAPGPAAPAA